MSERFGLSHRQVVRDVNEGKVVPPVDEAVTSSRGVSGGPSTQVIRSDDGSQRLLNSLLKAGGVVADKISAEAKRKAKIEGYNMAGTEEGRAAADEMGQTLNVKLFGPGAKLRSAQERIAQDQTDDNIAKLRSDLEDFGHKMTEEEWREHTDTQLASMTDKFEDEGLKDLITERFGRNIQAVKRDYEKSSKTFVQAEERETYVNSISSAAKMAQADLDSGDPQRQEDAEVRITESLLQPEGMSDEAYRSALAAAVKNELVNGRSALFDIAKSSGILEELDFEETQELQQAKLLHDSKNDEQWIRRVKTVEYLASAINSDNTPKASADEIAAMAKALQDENPAAYAASGIAPLVEAAFDRDLKIQAEKVRRRTAQHQYAVGDPALTRATAAEQQMAAADHFAELGEEGARKELEEFAAANGDTAPQGQEIPPGAANRWLLENPRVWARDWSTNSIVLDGVTQMGRVVLNNIGRLDITRDSATQLRSDLDSLMVIRDENPELFAKHFDESEAARLVKYHREMSIDSQNPYEVVQRLRDRERRQEQGLAYTPDPDKAAERTDDIIEMFVDEKGEEWLGIWNRDPENLRDLELHALSYYNEEYTRTGDPDQSRQYAMQRLNKGSTVIGNKFVLGGAKLDKNSYGGNFDRYLEGLDDSDEAHMKLVTQYKLPEGASLRDDANRFVVNPDGSGVTIWMEDETGVSVPVPVNIPRAAEDILPTFNEQMMATAREAAVESRNFLEGAVADIEDDEFVTAGQTRQSERALAGERLEALQAQQEAQQRKAAESRRKRQEARLKSTAGRRAPLKGSGRRTATNR
jgi:hypothetical protein